MKRVIVAGVCLLANVVGPAMAQISVSACANAGHGVNLQPTGTPSITSLLAPGTNVYACYNNGSQRENNETLVDGTNFQDYKLGPVAPGNKDPTAIVGTYTIGSGNYGGQIVYHYTAGKAFAYLICSTPTPPNTYYFINIQTAAILGVQVTSGPGSC